MQGKGLQRGDVVGPDRDVWLAGALLAMPVLLCLMFCSNGFCALNPQPPPGVP